MRRAVVVPGNAVRGPSGYRLSVGCERAVAAAERVALDGAADVVVFTGWARDGGPSEAAQMRELWRGPDVELVREDTASSTAENAARTLPLLVERDIDHATVVCSRVHLPRVRWFFRRVYEPFGIGTSFRTVPIPPSTRALAWEVVALTVARRQLRVARGELPRP